MNMKTLEKLQNLWAEDASIDRANLEKECIQIPNLHAKYLRLLSDEKVKLESLKQIQKEKQMDLENYYNGVYNENANKLQIMKRQPLNRIIPKTKIYQVVETDKDMQIILSKITIQTEIVNTLNEILKNINQRNFIIKNIIEWHRLTRFGED